MNKLASKFVKPDVLQMFKVQDKPFSTLDTSSLNQCDDIDSFIGMMTKQKLKQLLHDGDIKDKESDRVFRQLELSITPHIIIVSDGFH